MEQLQCSMKHINRPDQTWEFIEQTFLNHFPASGTDFLHGAFDGIRDLFSGSYPGYQGSDTPYHDLKHTCEATVALVRILDGHIRSGAAPRLSGRDFELAVAAVLLHDSGFMKRIGDREGTGAKYTLTHVDRSGEFAAIFLPPLGVTPDELRLVQLSIDCTGVNVEVGQLPFRNQRERLIGWALGTGDLLGQMAAPDYPDRLPELYKEFAEATDFTGDRRSWIAGYRSAGDLLKQTGSFFDSYVMSMLNEQYGGIHRALEHHFEDGTNHYLECIRINLDRIERLNPEIAPGD